MDDARDLLPVVGRHRQDVVVPVHRGVRVPEDGAELWVAEQPLDLVLHAVVYGRELLPDFGQLRAGGIDDMPAAVDAPADRLANRAEVLDRGQ